MTTVRLPWPSRLLSPNARVHRMVRAKQVKAARVGAAWECRAQGLQPWTGALPIRVVATFIPPRRGMDRDNMIASAKAMLDGVSAALGVDDRHFLTEFSFADPVKGGAVTITISEAT